MILLLKLSTILCLWHISSFPVSGVTLSQLRSILFGNNMLLQYNKSSFLSATLKGKAKKWKDKAGYNKKKADKVIKHWKKAVKHGKHYRRRKSIGSSSSSSSSTTSYDRRKHVAFPGIANLEDSGCSSSSYSGRRRHRRHHSSSTASSCVDNTIETLFPKKGRPLPKRDDVYFLDEKGGMKKSYGPFKDDESSPFYYPGLHQLDGKIGKRVLSDQEYRIHPSFMSKLADGGFYERRVIKPKDEKGADVVEERFGYFPKTGGNSNESNESDESSEYQPKKKRMGSNPDMSIFNAFMPGYDSQESGPQNYRTMPGLEERIGKQFEELKKSQTQNRDEWNKKHQALGNRLDKSTQKLQSGLDHKILMDLGSRAEQLQDNIDKENNTKEVEKKKNDSKFKIIGGE
ncbi:hypothetical protein ECANGB1_101 [Enterospora canceri]|uniref:Uncharacterized protein n=1 Tax=Enterospora canceri TaxID=1081671 RepID=A0A1Y1S4M9_9MICR|nr:hypothetical protein ECANGB1_101 [Enterospora canceri]